MPATTVYGYRKSISGRSLTIAVEEDNLPALAAFNRRLSDAEEKAGELRLLKFVIDYHYQKRTLVQNSFMWVLYTIEAYAQNAGMKGAHAQEVTAWKLYENDIDQYAPVVEVTVKDEHATFIRQEYRRAKVVHVEGGQTRIAIRVTTSHYNTKQMAEWIDRIMNRMAYFGIPAEKEAEVLRGWKDWRQLLNDEGITLHDDVMTADEYKEAVPICEATGAYLGDRGGSLAHISARGMGGNQEDWKDKPSNWLHLSDSAHALFDNGSGRAAFLEKYPHLRNKVEGALKKEVKPKTRGNAVGDLDIF